MTDRGRQSRSAHTRRRYVRISTIVMLALVAVPLALANLAPEPTVHGATSAQGFGWPLVWIWLALPGALGGGVLDVAWTALAANVATWAALFVAADLAARRLRRSLKNRPARTLRVAAAAGLAVCLLAVAGVALLDARADRRDAAIRDVQSVGGRVYLEHWGPESLDLLLPRRYRRRVIGATFVRDTEPASLSAAIVHFARFPALRRLDLENVTVADDALAGVGRLTSLEELYLNNTNVSDEGVAHLRGLKRLETLHLGSCLVSDAGLEALSGLENLEELHLPDTNVRGRGLAHLAELDRLRVLDLSYCDLDPQELEALEGLAGLESLHLTGTPLDDAAMPLLAGLPGLRTLDLVGTDVTAEGLRPLERLEKLQALGLGSWALSARQLDVLKSFPHVERLCITTAPGLLLLGEEGEELVPLEVDSAGIASASIETVEVRRSRREACRAAIEALLNERPDCQVVAHLPPLDERRGFTLRAPDVPPLVD